jgi:hypothetical protein
MLSHLVEDYGADVNLTDKKGNSALHRLARDPLRGAEIA